MKPRDALPDDPGWPHSALTLTNQNQLLAPFSNAVAAVACRQAVHSSCRWSHHVQARSSAAHSNPLCPRRSSETLTDVLALVRVGAWW
jgi:hypothetical protein